MVNYLLLGQAEPYAVRMTLNNVTQRAVSLSHRYLRQLFIPTNHLRWRNVPVFLPNITCCGYCSAAPKEAKDLVTVTFEMPDGETHTVKAKEGDSLLDVVISKNIPIDGYGACDGTLACSTCHVILSKNDYDKLPNKPSDEELDMLDLAYGLTDTSRLGCQVILKKNIEGLRVKVPQGIVDARQN